MASGALIVKQAVFAAGVYLSLIAATLLFDGVLHRLGLTWPGRVLGPLGTALIIASFGYSARKRKLMTYASPAKWLTLHEVLGWLGSLMILVHAGTHLNAVVPWLATVALLVVVASGATGSVLLKQAMGTLRDEGVQPSLADAVVVSAMKRWRAVHLPLNGVLLVLGLAHLISVLLLRGLS